MISIEFHLRRSRRGARYAGSLFVRVIAMRKSRSFTLPWRLYPSEWDEKEKRILYDSSPSVRHPYLKEVEKNLLKEKEKLLQIVCSFLEEDENTAYQVLTFYKNERFEGGVKKMSEFFVEELFQKGCERTARAYRTVVRRLLCSLGRDELPLNLLTKSTVEKFERILRDENKSLNTISFYMRNLRAIYNKGIKRGWLNEREESPFSRVYTSVAPSKKRALSVQEMKKLENLLLEDILEREEKEALSLFLFSFHGRGISFVDMCYLKKEDLKEDTLSYLRRKTGTPLQVKVSPIMGKLLSLLKEKTKDTSFLLPLIRENGRSIYRQYTDRLKKQNILLKKIANKVGLSKSLSTHMARHSWATIAKRENIPIWVISESLGHRSVETTYMYLDSFSDNVIDKAAGRVSRAVRRTA